MIKQSHGGIKYWQRSVQGEKDISSASFFQPPDRCVQGLLFTSLATS